MIASHIRSSSLLGVDKAEDFERERDDLDPSGDRRLLGDLPRRALLDLERLRDEERLGDRERRDPR